MLALSMRGCPAIPVCDHRCVIDLSALLVVPLAPRAPQKRGGQGGREQISRTERVKSPTAALHQRL